MLEEPKPLDPEEIKNLFKNKSTTVNKLVTWNKPHTLTNTFSS
jgi:hypothetical protein